MNFLRANWMNLERAAELIENLAESRSVEVKRWIDPGDHHGKSKIVKGLFALRNFNGGYLVIGFDDATLQPDRENAPSNARNRFHNDTIQAMVAHYASEPFDVEVFYPEKLGQEYPVIFVPSGVRTPVATKRELKSQTKTLIACDDVYFRTLQTNNRVSSAKIPYKDWPELMRICFNNHEADIGRFLRRHIVGLDPEMIGSLLKAATAISPETSIELQLEELLNHGASRLDKKLKLVPEDLPECGSFEVGLKIDGDFSHHKANNDFLRLLDTNNPRLTGWPIWLNRQKSQLGDQPYVMDDAWEDLIIYLGDSPFQHLEFMRKDPTGLFYLWRALEDDISASQKAPAPETTLDFALAILRVAEAIAVGRAFALALGCEPEKTALEFSFRWRGLEGRQLSSWANPERFIFPSAPAVQGEFISRASVPLDAPMTAIPEYTRQVVEGLFAVFGGYSISAEAIDDLVNRLLERRL